VSDWRSLVATLSVLGVAGLVNFNNVARKPAFETLPTVDLLQLIVTGMCIGAAVFALVLFFRGSRPG
jgi:hypothetical protein